MTRPGRDAAGPGPRRRRDAATAHRADRPGGRSPCVLALMFGGVAVASWVGGEPFLAVMGGIGCLMTVWVGALTLLRG